MDRSDVIKLVKETYTIDSIGNYVPTETSRTVFCRVNSVTGQEWYAGGQNGIRPQYQIQMFKYDYEDELIVEYKNERYSVYRTYEARNDTLELYVEKKGRDNVNQQESQN